MIKVEAKAPNEETPPVYKKVFYCPKSDQIMVDINSSTRKPRGVSEGKISKINCRFDLPGHKDSISLVVIPLSSIVDHTAQARAYEQAEKIFRDIIY